MSHDEEHVAQSFLSWAFSSLGVYALILPLAGLVCFLLALIVVIRGNGPMAVAALMLVVHVPLLIGIVAVLQGALASYMVIAASSTAPKPSEVAAGISKRARGTAGGDARHGSRLCDCCARRIHSLAPAESRIN